MDEEFKLLASIAAIAQNAVVLENVWQLIVLLWLDTVASVVQKRVSLFWRCLKLLFFIFDLTRLQLLDQAIEDFLFTLFAHRFTLLVDQWIVSVFYHMLCFTSLEIFGDLSPFLAFFLNKFQENQVLLRSPHSLYLVWVQMVHPSLSTLFWRPIKSMLTQMKKFFWNLIPLDLLFSELVNTTLWDKWYLRTLRRILSSSRVHLAYFFYFFIKANNWNLRKSYFFWLKIELKIVKSSEVWG